MFMTGFGKFFYLFFSFGKGRDILMVVNIRRRMKEVRRQLSLVSLCSPKTSSLMFSGDGFRRLGHTDGIVRTMRNAKRFDVVPYDWRTT